MQAVSRPVPLGSGRVTQPIRQVAIVDHAMGKPVRGLTPGDIQGSSRVPPSTSVRPSRSSWICSSVSAVTVNSLPVARVIQYRLSFRPRVIQQFLQLFTGHRLVPTLVCRFLRDQIADKLRIPLDRRRRAARALQSLMRLAQFAHGADMNVQQGYRFASEAA